jgi:predicted homoserine dehydrogenase-like protein
MIIVDTALATRERESRPVRVAIVGLGYMGRAIARQLLRPVPGMRLAAVYNRTPAEAARPFLEAGHEAPQVCSSAAQLRQALAAGRAAAVDDPQLLTHAEGIDVVLEATGEVEFGATIALSALEHGKHVVLMNAELDATVGPILKTYADRSGVVLTDTDGDEPGVAMNLVRFARTIGYEPVCAGNLKGMIDPYRTPETQREFAERNQQKPIMITSFADGTKLSMEATILANAAGFGVARRGMLGQRCAHVKDTLKLFTPEQFTNGGLVDYILGADPHTGAFVLGYNENPIDRQYMNYFKMGDGPLYCFYTPYHLPHLQILTTIARAALFSDPTVTPVGRPYTEVIAMAKRDLAPGETLDGIGGFCCYGTIENADVAHGGRHLPMGLTDGCRVRRTLPKDHALTYDDVELPEGRLVDRLRREQDERFGAELQAQRRRSLRQ